MFFGMHKITFMFDKNFVKSTYFIKSVIILEMFNTFFSENTMYKSFL